MVEQCEKAMPTTDETDVVHQVRHLLKQSAVDFPTQDDIATQLHLSPRSLRRHLQRHQIAVINSERIDRAKTLFVIQIYPSQQSLHKSATVIR